MFDIGWSELLVIGVVLIVVVGPKDLPRMLRTFGRTTTQLRRMAGDFRKQFDEALREAEMEDVRTTVNDLKSLNPTNDIRKAMNPMRAVGDEIRSSLMAATRAPEPKVPSATAPAAPADPSIAAVAEAQPMAATTAVPPPAPVAMEPSTAAGTAFAVPAPVEPLVGPEAAPTPVYNGLGLNGVHHEGEAK